MIIHIAVTIEVRKTYNKLCLMFKSQSTDYAAKWPLLHCTISDYNVRAGGFGANLNDF